MLSVIWNDAVLLEVTVSQVKESICPSCEIVTFLGLGFVRTNSLATYRSWLTWILMPQWRPRLFILPAKCYMLSWVSSAGKNRAQCSEWVLLSFCLDRQSRFVLDPQRSRDRSGMGTNAKETKVAFKIYLIKCRWNMSAFCCHNNARNVIEAPSQDWIFHKF